MTPLKNLLVALDLTEIDEVLILYTAFLSSQPAIEKVYFVHVSKQSDVPEEVLHSFGQGNLPADTAIKERIDARVHEHFAGVPHVHTEVHILEGTPLKELLRFCKQKDIDLLVVGRKLRLRGSGALSHKLLRTGRLSVLFVPETAEMVLKKIVVSIDFSDYSMLALDQVLHSAVARPDVEIVCLHIYQVPTGYITLGISYEDFEERMRGFAIEKFENVLDSFPELRSRASLKLVKREQMDDVGELVVLEAKRAKADMLAIGAQGKSATALFVLGSVTEKILDDDTDIPLIVFKKKDEEVGFLDALIGR